MGRTDYAELLNATQEVLECSKNLLSAVKARGGGSASRAEKGNAAIAATDQAYKLVKHVVAKLAKHRCIVSKNMMEAGESLQEHVRSFVSEATRPMDGLDDTIIRTCKRLFYRGVVPSTQNFILSVEAFKAETCRNAECLMPSQLESNSDRPKTPPPVPKRVTDARQPARRFLRPLPKVPPRSRNTDGSDIPADKLIIVQKMVRKYMARRRFRQLVTEYCDSKSSLRQRMRCEVLKEIIESERRYIHHLYNSIKFYLKPLRAITSSQEWLKAEDVEGVFSSIEVIYGASMEIVTQLDDRMQQWPAKQLFGDIFLQLAPIMKLYSSYINDYEISSQTLERIKTSRKAAAFIEELHTASGEQLDLEAYLIMPVQRLPRYEILLRELIKQTGEDHVDYDNLQRALVEIKHLNRVINQRKRDRENRDLIVSISNVLEKCTIALVQPHRIFLKEGTLRFTSPQHKGALRESYVFLFNDLLIVAKVKTPLKEYKVEQQIMLENCEVEEEGCSKYGLNAAEAFILKKTDSSKMTWVVALPASDSGHSEDLVEWKTFITDAMAACKVCSLCAASRQDEDANDPYRRLCVKLVAGSDLPPMDSDGLADPYCTLQVGTAKKTSKVIKDSLHPSWNESFTFTLKNDPPLSDVLIVKCYDRDKVVLSEKIGELTVNLDLVNLEPEKEKLLWVNLKKQDESFSGVSSGKILLSLCVRQIQEK